MDGGTGDIVANMVGSSASPFVKVTGQLWKKTGGATVLQPKFLAAMAYVGRSPLVDISGATSSIPTDPKGYGMPVYSSSHSSAHA